MFANLSLLFEKNFCIKFKFCT